jgi:hypothetical protein
MNNQEAFDIVYRHLIAQGDKALNARGTYCMYRAPEGRKCAIGALIPDELYSREMDSHVMSVREMKETFPKIAALFADIEVTLLEDLQSVHDDIPVEYWVKDLGKVARHYNLTIPEVQHV